MPQGNLAEFLRREVRQGSPGELMMETSPSRQRRPPCKTNRGMSDEAADAAALTYLLSVICCPGVQHSRRPRTLVLVSHSSLNPLPLDITCSEVVCRDVGVPCALSWVPCDLVPWCMIFSEVMRAGGTFVPGPPSWEVKFSRLMCSGVGGLRTMRRAGLGVTLPCSPAGAGGLVGPVCWAPDPPLVWLAGKGG